MCHEDLFPTIMLLSSGATVVEMRPVCREGWTQWTHDHKRVVVGTAEENLHDIFLHSLELNPVKTVEKATELFWPAEIMETNGGAFKLIF